MCNGICDPVLYLKSEGSNVSWILRYSSIVVLKNDICKNDITLFFENAMGWYEILEVNLSKNEYNVLSFLKFDF